MVEPATIGLPKSSATVIWKVWDPALGMAEIGPMIDGIHVAALAEMNLGSGYRFVGIDISQTALGTARSRGNVQRTFVHGTVLELPLASGTFDAAFSFGVAAYTADPEGSFAELCRVVKPNGLVGIWVYPKPRGLAGSLLNTIRATYRRTGPFFTNRIADLLVPFLPLLPTRSKVTLRNSTWKECRELGLVNIAPKRLVFPDTAEIHAWFARRDVRVVTVDEENPVTIWGRVPANTERTDGP